MFLFELILIVLEDNNGSETNKTPPIYPLSPLILVISISTFSEYNVFII